MGQEKKKKKLENPISQFARFGGDMKSRFSKILKKTLVEDAQSLVDLKSVALPLLRWSWAFGLSCANL